MTPDALSAAAALDAYYLDARAKLLDLAATLDRVGRGAGAEAVAADPRLAGIRQALDVLRAAAGGRAAAVQQIFSVAYDPAWPKPAPKA